MQEMIENIIEEYPQLFDIAGGMEEEEIRRLEDELMVHLPESYRWFLNQYGSIQVDSREILGIESKEKTYQYKENELPMYYVVLEEEGEYLYCLDVELFGKGDCPVMLVNLDEQEVTYFTSSFYDYLFYRLYDPQTMEEDEMLQEFERIEKEISENEEEVL